VQAALAEAVKDDDIIYHGQAGHLLLKKIPHHLRLKVVADMEYRIKAAIERTNFSRDRAISYVRDLDEERDKWVQWVYGVDRNDPTTYDMIINLESIAIPDACEVVIDVIRRSFPTTEASRQAIADLVLASELQARIAMDESIADDVVEIEAKDGLVTITGTVRSLVDAERVREVVNSVSGVERIESRMGTRW
jgi:hypothetical protein